MITAYNNIGSNMSDEYSKIEVVPHDPKWSEKFEQEAAIIREIFGDNLVKVHHIGSTSIPGIKAKPIIDIIPVVKDIMLVDNYNQAMEKVGYRAHGEYGITGRRYFVKFDGNKVRIVNCHCYELGNDEVERYTLFRDHMIANPEDALAYSNLKEELAKKFPNDIDSYVNGKDSFVKAIDKKTGFDGLSMRIVLTNYEWAQFHRIRKSEIFSRNNQVIYDQNHPSLTDPDYKNYVFYKGSDVIGVFVIQKLNKDTSAFRAIAIDKAFQSKGYGSILLKQAEKIAKNLGFKKVLLHANHEAYNFYKRNSYVEMDFPDTKRLYADSIDMGKWLL
jgi:GrpB-like predicted nucleotidyltransferase (UPF0157 family)/GNAT superfamily N-acetyltransferase